MKKERLINQFTKRLIQVLTSALKRKWMLLCLSALFIGGWYLDYQERRQVERERALYNGHTINELIDQAMQQSNYYSCSWTLFEEPETNVDVDQKVIDIGAPAVPELIKRLRGLHTGWLHSKLITWRIKYMPSWLPQSNYLAIPRDVSGDAAYINYLLSQMGDAARPAVPAMLDSARDVHIWAYYDLLHDFVRMGDAGRDALPKLKEWAQNGDENAAEAVTYIEQGNTERLRWYLPGPYFYIGGSLYIDEFSFEYGGLYWSIRIWP